MFFDNGGFSMPEPNSGTKTYKVKKLRVHEVSLATYPKNEFSFITIKEGGKHMSAIFKLIASLSQKSDKIPEAMKEELKAGASEITVKDFLEAMTEAGIKANDLLAAFPGKKVIDEKDFVDKTKFDVVEKAKFDVVEKGTWELKKKEPEVTLPPEVKKQLEAQDKEIATLKKDKTLGTLKEKLGEDIAKGLVDAIPKLSEAESTFVMATIEGLQKVVKDLGKKIGENGQLDMASKEARENAIKKIAEEKKINITDATIEWAKANHSLAAQY
jgi:hypothetical protein